MHKYYGITHAIAEEDLDKHKEDNCPRGVHAFDEVLSDESHYLYCDACGLTINISSIVQEI